MSGDPREFSGVSGFRTHGIAPYLDSTSGAPYRLHIGIPLVNYERLEGPLFTREISTDITFVDSTEHLSTVTWLDTIHRKHVPSVRRTSHPELRGEDPRRSSRYLWPGVLVGVGITGIISLFYIRSN